MRSDGILNFMANFPLNIFLEYILINQSVRVYFCSLHPLGVFNFQKL